MLYTVVMDYRGGSYISQVEAFRVADALKAWANALDHRAIAGLGPHRKAQLIDDIKVQLSRGPEQPALLDGLVNAWCVAALTSGGLALINIFATVGEKTSRTRSPR